MWKRIIFTTTLIVAFATPAMAQEDTDRCLVEVRALTARSIEAGFPPVLAVEYLESPDPATCTTVHDYVTNWWGQLTVDIRPTTNKTTSAQPIFVAGAPRQVFGVHPV